MPTIKEKSDEKFVGQEFDDTRVHESGGRYYSAGYNAFHNKRARMFQTPPFVAYSHAIKSRDEVETKLRAVKCERDKLNKNISALEAELEAANFTVEALGSTEVP